MLADLVREDQDCEPAIAELLREVLPFTTAVLVPPGWDERYVTVFGFTLMDIFAQGAESMEGRLRAAGLKPEPMRVGLAFDLPATERARRGLALLRAGYLGAPNGPVVPNAEATRMLFDGLRRQIDTSVAPGTTIQWSFTDAQPWHLRIDNGSASVGQGPAERADLTFRCRFADWVDLAAGRIEPRRALVTGKIRPTGRLRMLVRAPKLFG
jgi:hypothetical protein